MTRWFDLNDAQWAILESLLPAPRRPGRPSKWTKRQLIDGTRRRVRVGAPWRDVPECHGSWQAVYALFRRWRRDGIWARILASPQARAADVLGPGRSGYVPTRGIRPRPIYGHLRRRGIGCTIPEAADQIGHRIRRGGRPPDTTSSPSATWPPSTSQPSTNGSAYFETRAGEGLLVRGGLLHAGQYGGFALGWSRAYVAAERDS
ncbi:transposase [Actinomadura sp. NAK00032]|uniref:transposase n=1 Tax=Actinomadura sp. NAK00032 TaxID=2742128 RepID=UPI001C37B4D1